MNYHTREPRSRRRGFAALAAAAGLALLAAGCGSPKTSSSPSPTSASSESPGTGNRSAVSGGALFGGNLPLAQEEAKLGRKLAIVRVYDTIGDAFPGPNRPLLAAGSTLLVSLDSNGASYASIAAGNQDAAIGAFLQALNKAAVQYHLAAIYFCFESEPDNAKHGSLGSPAQFIQAWDHVHQLAESAQLNWNDGGRLHWVFILIHSAFGNGLAAQYWPGTGEVDVVAADGYNTYACKLAKHGRNISAKATAQVTPAAIFGPAVSFAAAHGGLPVFLSEWASDNPVSSSTQPGFIRQMQAYVAANREIAAVLYWDSDGAHCQYSVNSNPASVAALATMGRSGALQGRLATPAK
jgi:hypothetical protein